MDNKIHLQIVTAGEAVYDKMVSYVGVPLSDGEAGILADHAAMLAALGAGVIKARAGEDTENISVSGGVLSVKDNELIILAESAELIKE